MLKAARHAENRVVAAKCCILTRICCKLLWFKKYWPNLNETSHVPPPLVGKKSYQIRSCCTNQKGCCNLQQTQFFCSKLVFSAVEKMKLQWNSISSIFQVFLISYLSSCSKFKSCCNLQQHWDLWESRPWCIVSTQIHLNWQAGQSYLLFYAGSGGVCWKWQGCCKILQFWRDFVANCYN